MRCTVGSWFPAHCTARNRGFDSPHLMTLFTLTHVTLQLYNRLISVLSVIACCATKNSKIFVVFAPFKNVKSKSLCKQLNGSDDVCVCVVNGVVPIHDTSRFRDWGPVHISWTHPLLLPGLSACLSVSLCLCASLYNVFGVTLNLTLSIYLCFSPYRDNLQQSSSVMIDSK